MKDDYDLTLIGVMSNIEAITRKRDRLKDELLILERVLLHWAAILQDKIKHDG